MSSNVRSFCHPSGKYGGSWMYVLVASNSNSSPPFPGIAFHCSFLLPTF